MNLTIRASRQNSMTTTQHSFNSHFPAQPWVSWYQNASIILDFIGAKDDRGSGDKWSYMTHKAPFISWPPTNQHAAFHCWDALPLAHQTVSKHWTQEVSHYTILLAPKLIWVFQPCLRPLKAPNYLGGGGCQATRQRSDPSTPFYME